MSQNVIRLEKTSIQKLFHYQYATGNLLSGRYEEKYHQREATRKRVKCR